MGARRRRAAGRNSRLPDRQDPQHRAGDPSKAGARGLLLGGRLLRMRKKKAASQDRLFPELARSFLERDPDAVAPITAAVMFAPAIAVTAPPPVIVMNADAPCGTIVITVGDVPAVAMAIAGDIGRRRRSRGRQRSGACAGAQTEESEIHL